MKALQCQAEGEGLALQAVGAPERYKQESDLEKIPLPRERGN